MPLRICRLAAGQPAAAGLLAAGGVTSATTGCRTSTPGAPAVAANSVIRPSAAAPASPPNYAYDMGDGQILAHHEKVLSVGIATVDLDSLEQLLARHQGSLKQSGHAAGGSAAGGGELQSNSWSSLQYLKAEIRHCPAFLNCDSDSTLRRIDGSPMIWDFVLSAKDTASTQDGVIIVAFSGSPTAEGPYYEIASLPGLLAGVHVVRDAAWWSQTLTGWEGAFNALHGLLDALGAVFVVLSGWWAWVWVRRRRQSTKDSAAAKEPAPGA